MSQEVLRLKNDVLNELRNEKYYVQDDLRAIVDDSSMPQREKVSAVIDAVSSLVQIDAKIVTVENIFQTPVAEQPIEQLQDEGSSEPTNVVEPTGTLNPQGQTHSE